MANAVFCHHIPGDAEPGSRLLLPFFAQALSTFRALPSAFRVICTLPPPSPRPSSSSATQMCNYVSTTPTPHPPAKSPSKIVVLDSSFNPPTVAHLDMAVSAVRAELSQVSAVHVRLLLLLAVNNADKVEIPASFEHRLGLMWGFAKDVQGNSLDVSIDLALTTQPYFYAKSAAIAEAEFYHSEGEVGAEQVLLAGYDTLTRIFNPKYYYSDDKEDKDGTSLMRRALDPLFARVRLRVTMRTADKWGGREEQEGYLRGLLGEDAGGLARVRGNREWAERVEMVEGMGKEKVVSSTLARKAAEQRDEEALARLVSEEVRKWVQWEGLYKKAADFS